MMAYAVLECINWWVQKSITSIRYKQFLTLLIKKRKERGLYQSDISKILETTQPTISKMETGELRIDVVQLESMCLAIGITLSDFVKEFEKTR